MLRDVINGCFEGGGAVILSMNTITLVKSKKVQGVHWFPVVVWTAWGLWNLYYYPSLGQWASFYGGLGVVIQNIVWLLLAWKYRGDK